MKPPHRTGPYQVNARRVRQAAATDPNTRCWRCGLTLTEHAPHRNGRRPWWTAGHLRDGDPTSPLLPEASTCNYAAGGAITPNTRATGYSWP